MAGAASANQQYLNTITLQAVMRVLLKFLFYHPIKEPIQIESEVANSECGQQDEQYY
jgi:hypothetical protein